MLLGTLYPLVLDALGMGKISVGPPYFDTVFVPLMAPALFLMGIGPMARWRSAQVGDLARKLRWALAVSGISAVAGALRAGPLDTDDRLRPAAGRLGGQHRAAEPVAARCASTRRRAGRSAWRPQPGSYYGMLLAHLGVAVFVFGVTVVNGFQVEKDVRMEPGESAEIAGMRVRFDGVREVRGPNYVAARGTLVLSRGERQLAVLHPERRNYLVSACR